MSTAASMALCQRDDGRKVHFGLSESVSKNHFLAKYHVPSAMNPTLTKVSYFLTSVPLASRFPLRLLIPLLLIILLLLGYLLLLPFVLILFPAFDSHCWTPVLSFHVFDIKRVAAQQILH
jgi:hypothetical protein